MPARLHPGSPRHVWDHLVIGLRSRGGEAGYASLYDIRWSAELGPGTVCFVVTEQGRTLALADDPGLGDRMQRRLRALGAATIDLDAPMLPATFARRATSGSVRYRVEASDHVIELGWEGLQEPVWVEGGAPAFTPDEDIWALFQESHAPSIVVDGTELDGSSFPDDAWVPKLGRPLSSAHLALAEVRVTPVR